MLHTPMESLIMYALSDGSHGMESETRPGDRMLGMEESQGAIFWSIISAPVLCKRVQAGQSYRMQRALRQ
jgi:hypothetical protein